MIRKITAFLTISTLTGSVLSAGPLGMAVSGLGTVMMGVANDVVSYGGPAMVLLGGGRTAWKLAHGEHFTTPLLAAIVGVALFMGVSAGTTFGTVFTGVEQVGGGLNLMVSRAGMILGGLVSLIGGCVTGYRMAHGEPWVKSLIFAIAAAAVAAVSVIAS